MPDRVRRITIDVPLEVVEEAIEALEEAIEAFEDAIWDEMIWPIEEAAGPNRGWDISMHSQIVDRDGEKDDDA